MLLSLAYNAISTCSTHCQPYYALMYIQLKIICFRSPKNIDRPGYDGMGLGLFIAKTLLERSGAELEFLNASGGHFLQGAVVRGVWPRRKLEANKPPIGQNQPIEIG